MANFYGDDILDPGDIMDDELLELETEFISSNSPLKRSMNKLQSTTTTNEEKNFDWLNTSETNKPTIDNKKSNLAPTKRTAVRFSQDNFDNDILDSMGFDDTKTDKQTDKATKKDNILNELFRKPSDTAVKPKTKSFTDILQTSQLASATNTIPSTTSELSVNTTRKRSERRNSTMLDPLGLFGPVQPASLNESTTNEKVTTAQKIEPSKNLINDKPNLNTNKNDGLPGWLTGNKIERPATSPTPGTSSTNKFITKKTNENTKKLSNPENDPEPKEPPKEPNLDNSSITQMLQQQESQLMIALQLKKMEERLINIEKHQKTKQDQQERHIKQLLDEQGDRQKYVQEQITNQQERINEQMQNLMFQPFSSETPQNNSEANSQFLDQAIEKFRSKYVDEVQAIEASYRKQIILLEEASEAIELRLKSEIDRVSQFYQAKIIQFETELETIETKNKNKIDSIHEEYGEELKRIRDHHKTMMDNLQSQHINTIDKIRQNKLLENNLISESDISSYGAILKESLDKLQTQSADVIEIQNFLKQQFDLQISDREAQIKSKEMELNLKIKSSEKQRELLENDRSRLIALVESLELKLSEQTLAFKETEWKIQNRETQLLARENALDKQIVHIQQMAEREKAHIDSMRQAALEEHEKLNKQITEQRLALVAEQSKAQTTAKLVSNFDSLKTRTEVDAAIIAAQEAAKAANSEREKYLQERRQLELQQQELQSKEKHLKNREIELNNLMEICEKKKTEATETLNDAKKLEMKYNEQSKHIQNQLASLRIREKKLAEDKVSLAKERMAVHKSSTSMCHLCASNNMIRSNTPTFDKATIEAELARFQINDDNIEK